MREFSSQLNLEDRRPNAAPRPRVVSSNDKDHQSSLLANESAQFKGSLACSLFPYVSSSSILPPFISFRISHDPHCGVTNSQNLCTLDTSARARASPIFSSTNNRKISPRKIDPMSDSIGFNLKLNLPDFFKFSQTAFFYAALCKCVG